MAPIVIVIAAAGLIMLSRRRRSGVTATAAATEEGFILLPDCIHMRVTNPQKMLAAVESLYRKNSLSGGQQFRGGPGAADAHTRAFFTHYFTKMAPNCLADRGKVPASQMIYTDPLDRAPGPPRDASMAQQIMYGFVYSGFAALLLKDNLWGDSVAAAQMVSLVNMLKQSGLTLMAWNEVFMNTVPVPEGLDF